MAKAVEDDDLAQRKCPRKVGNRRYSGSAGGTKLKGPPIKYDPHFNGPLKNRSCTDVICLLLFLVFIACWAGIGWYAIANGDPQTLLVPKDSSGGRCGMDSHLIDRPYLFFFDLTKCLDASVPFTGCPTTQVCVAQCPNATYIKDQYWSTDITPYCTYDNSSCPDWFLPSTSVLKRCLYHVADRKRTKWKIANIQGDEISMMKEYLSPVHMWMDLAVENGLVIFTKDDSVQEIGQNVVKDVINSWWKILIGVGLALVACLIYILILRWLAAFMVWLSIFGVIVALGAGVYFTAQEYIKWRDQYDQITYEEESAQTKRDLWLAGLIILSVILGIILLVLIFLRSRINLAIALIKEGSRAVSSVTAVLFFPIFPWVLQIGVIAYAICVGVYLATTGDPLYKSRYVSESCWALTGVEDNVVCEPNNFTSLINQTTEIILACRNASCKFISMQNEAFYPYLQAINIFGFFWLAFFVSALGQMVLAQVFAQWYWTFKKSNLPFFAVTAALYRTVRYHIGTLAFGSLIIAICRMIRIGLEYLDHKLKKYDNAFTKAILCCLKCFFWCLEKFLKFINKNAYIMCAVHGKNFCTSAKDAFMLLMRNIIRVFVLDKVTDFLFFLSKLLVTLGVGAVAYVFFATDLISFIDNSSLNYGVVPVILIMIATYLISTLFFNVYSMAVDTLFLCFLEDCERNDGSAEKPYYMSRGLMKIFGKKNKRQ